MASTDANNLTTSVARDGRFDLQSVKNGANQAMHGFTPDPVHRAGQTTMGTGSRSLALNATMNANGDLASVAGSDNRTTSVFRDQGDPSLVTSLRWQDTAGNKNRQDLKYDAYGRVVEVDMDFAFNPNAQTDTATYIRVFTYDAEDHLLTAGIPGRTQTEYAYASDGMRNAMYVFVGAGANRPNGTEYVKYAYGYDGARRVTSVTVNYADHSHNVLGSTTLASANYTYDGDGRVIAVRTPKATTVYAYDALGQMTGLQNLTPDGTVDPNAPTAAQATDPYNGTAHSILSSFSNFTYDLRGDRTGMSFSAMSYVSGSASYGSGSTAWGYDAAGRLTSESWSGVVSFGSSYGYDGGDNLTSLRGIGLGIDAASDQLTASPFSGPGTSYDPRNYLSSATGTSTYNTSETYTLTPAYDEAGHRRSQQLDLYRGGNDTASTDSFTYDGDALVYRSHSASSGLSPSDLSFDANVLYLWGPTGPVMEFDLSGHAKAFTFDPEGNCLSTTDGFVVQPVFFDAYGAPINSYAGDDRYRQQPLQYEGQAGYYRDAYSGLEYCLHRYYDPRVGRWTQRDPIGLEGGVNVYGYCGGNPIMAWDPSGLQQQSFEQLMQNAFGLFTQNDINHFYALMARGFAEKAQGTPMGAMVGLGYYGYKKDYVGMMMSVGSLGLNIGLSALDSEVDPIWSVTDGLATYTSEAALEARLTPRQIANIARHPEWEEAHWGTQIDTLVKRKFANDPYLSKLGVKVAPPGKFGPDFHMPKRKVWWDVTTEKAWPSHVRKYSSYGKGILIKH